jgi:biopolymer transport protein ExbD
MAMSVAAPEDDTDLNTTINTTPLVDVMLVMLIIFLITIPVVIHNVKLTLPVAKNIATVTKPQNIVIAVDRDGNVYWNQEPVANSNELITRMEGALKAAAAKSETLPEVHIRGDRNARFEAIGRVVYDAQRAGIPKIGFITDPIPVGEGQ